MGELIVQARVAKLLFERGGLLLLVVAVIYAWLAPTHFVDGENAEFSTLSVLGGAAHPSGYPLYVLWLRATSWLPGASPAHTAGLATVVLGVLACGVLHAACRAWGARPAAATLAVAVFAAAPVVLRLHTEAEVFALNNLIVALVLWLAAEHGPLRGVRRAAMLGLVAGLGLSNHLTCALVAPLGILGVVQGARESQHAVRAVALAGVGLVLGLTPYLYLLIAPASAMSWGPPRDLAALVAHALREDYGGAAVFRPGAATVSVADNLGAFAATLGRGWLWLLPIIGLVTLGVRALRPDPAHRRLAWAMLAASWLVAGPLLVTRFNIPPTGVGLLVCQRFHLLPLLLLTIPVAIGIDHAGQWLAGRVRFAVLRSPAALAGLACVVVVTLAVTSLGQHAAITSRAVQASVENVLGSLPPDAVLIEETDELHAGSIYLQAALGVRPDVTVITWGMTKFPWYRERVARGRISIAPSASELDVAEQVLASGRPLFVDLSRQAILGRHLSYPYGPVFRVVPRGGAQLSIEAMYELNRGVFERFDLAYPRPRRGDGYPSGIHGRYVTTWKILANGLAQRGKRDEAAAALEFARQLAPE